MIEHYLDLLQPLGIQAPAVRFDLQEIPADGRMALPFDVTLTGGSGYMRPGPVMGPEIAGIGGVAVHA